MLKAWMRRHFQELKGVFAGNFEGFLKHALEASECDKAAVRHFKYSKAGYKFEGDFEAFERELEAWSKGEN